MRAPTLMGMLGASIAPLLGASTQLGDIDGNVIVIESEPNSSEGCHIP